MSLIGNILLLKLNCLIDWDLVSVYVKIEGVNFMGSMKDCMVFFMI